jgi:hypothetical protein
LKSARSLLSNAKERPEPSKMTLSIKERDPRVPSLNMVLRKLQSLRRTPMKETSGSDEEGSGSDESSMSY